MSKYINEAFKQFRLLEDFEDFSLNPDGMDNLGSFINQAMDDESVDVIDPEVEAEEDLKKSYVGKVICDCNVCHSNIFYNKEDIVVDDDGVANIEDECPYCMSTDGYTIVGEIKEYEPGMEEEEVDVDTEFDDELADEPIEISDEEDYVMRVKPNEQGAPDFSTAEEVKESYNRRKARKLNESKRRTKNLREGIFGNKKSNSQSSRSNLREGIENVSIDTEDETMTMTTKEDGGITIETTPRYDEDGYFYDDMDMAGADTDIDFADDVEAGDEVIAPLSDETEEKIMQNSEDFDDEEGFDEEEFGEEEFGELPDGEEVAEGEEELDVEPEEFDEESFDGLGESYLRRCYENVSGFKTTGVRIKENMLTVEGIINFKSGAKKKTNFIFESKNVKNKKLVFEGSNGQIAPNKKSFKLTCGFKDKKLLPESLSYKYSQKNAVNESVTLKGRVKVKK